MSRSSQSIKAIVNSIQKFYPTRLADKSWDNTGLLVEGSSLDVSVTEDKSAQLNILLTIDLTQSVADEGVAHNSSLILAYHPFIFRGLKSITTKDPQQRSLLKLISNGISVYCPHTAIDAAKGGVNDFLADGLAALQSLKSREVCDSDPKDHNEGEGMGRLVEFNEPVALTALVKQIKSHLQIDHVQVATADEHKKISTVALCAGSGGSVFKGVDADLYYTGELSHHEALFFKENGKTVILTNHTNCERGYLTVVKENLQRDLSEQGYTNVDIKISETDVDPLKTW
ncbi:hypothetical protein BABINDRAFT_162049 [Babjeviella inositovora NRRL Y-12698]|uniref:YbgI/family dinuclear metal center protein n=1 Tax=Babjeviella inositovora NRRL Y-12698 TaxID=984486 RepID=A0A1E3QMR0_9ASCO|nr:uncharacterized protein BABINDRAFT_162049 [Babjeviella inositovora NRRL Y-12698]ODQ78963.1 hypothetical protein BABINDRAFT_162049 [Babjeviella inositovora NRRL Y-12698]